MHFRGGPATLRRMTAGVLASAVLALPPARAEGSPASRALTQEGFALAYDLQFAASYEVLAEAAAADPRDPAPPRAIAAVTWMEALFSQGVATFEAFTGEISKSDVARPPTPQQLAERFQRNIRQAGDLAQQLLARTDDADAHYQAGATDALAALYGASVEGRTVGSLTQGRRAVNAMERARERDPQKKETALLIGMSHYAISTMSWPARTMAKLSGMSGNREKGLALLEEAASPGAETQTDALLLLMIVENREGRHADAARRLIDLQKRHPRNRLLWLNHGATSLAADEPLEADRVLTAGMAVSPPDAPPSVLGETALWYAHRGTARVQLSQTSEAAADLQQGLLSSPRDWIRGRIYAQLGELALIAGERAQARRQFEAALRSSERGGNRTAVKETKQKLNALKRD